MSGHLLQYAFVYLAAAVLVVPIARRLGLGSVLGYLIAGVVLGPFVLGLVGKEGQDVMHFAEFGVVMMLFLVGLELQPARLWAMRRPIFGLGGAQVLVTLLTVSGLLILSGMPWRTTIVIGCVIACSSTAIVLQTLAEKRLLATEGGQASFSVLLFQDIAVIPMLALFPLLAVSAPTASAGHGSDRPGWQTTLLLLGVITAIVLGGKYVSRWLFRALAETRLREVFTAGALALVIGVTLVMEWVGMSPALGTFLAGVVLANNEYRHELESDIEPFKGLLLGVFFMSVGASIDFGLIFKQPLPILGFALALMAGKGLILAVLAKGFGLTKRARFIVSFSLVQAGEFAFVLIAFASKTQVLPDSVSGILTAVVAVSMLLTPPLMLAFDKLVFPKLRVEENARAQDEVTDEHSEVVLAGFGRFGQVIGRMLRSAGHSTTVLDLDPGMVDVLRRVGHEVHYGDASRLDLLKVAGCESAKLFVVAVDEPAKALEIVKTLRTHFPELPILARARNRGHYYELRRAGVVHIYRETFDSALGAGAGALRLLGMRAHQAERLANAFRKHDEEALLEMEPLYGQKEAFFTAARKMLNESERLLRSEANGEFGSNRGWDNEALRKNPDRQR